MYSLFNTIQIQDKVLHKSLITNPPVSINWIEVYLMKLISLFIFILCALGHANEFITIYYEELSN